MKKLLVVDGNSILNRAFYGTENSFMKNAEGLYTGAVYGFLNILLKYLEEDKPDYIAVAFDVKQPTFRHIEYEEYKKTRKGMPDELAAQLPVAKELLHALNIPVIEKPGYEADDIIGTFANFACQGEVECIILTGDRDSLQLVDECTHVKLPVTRGGRTNTEYYDKEAVYEKYGVQPKQLIDVKALMGDTSDNVPGIPGIGEKTALALIQEYGSLDDVFSNSDKITKPALKVKIETGKELAYLSKMLVTICREVPIDLSLEDVARKDFDQERLLTVLNKLEFRSVIKRMGLGNKEATAVEEKKEVQVQPDVSDSVEEMVLPEKIHELSGLDEINNFPIPAIIERIYITYKISSNELREINFRFNDSRECVSFMLPGSMFAAPFLERFKSIFEDKDIKKIMFDAKPLVLWLMQNDCSFNGLYIDVAIASYLSDSTRTVNNITEVYRYYTGKEIKEGTLNELFALKEIEENIKVRLEKDRQQELFFNVEIPLVNILASFEYLGFKVNGDMLRESGKEFDKRLNELTTIIHDLAGKVFNINSPKQLGEVLFDDLQLEGKKKTKIGYKTDIEVLENLYDAHPIIPYIIEYRQNAKLKSTYIDGLLNSINPITGRVHSSFNQMGTATGRLSSTEPNLQNLPTRSEIGRQIRRAFEPADRDHILIDADYSQIELRVLAHISQDSTMIEAFKNNEDIHRITASKVFNVDIDQVSSAMRSKAKAVNFGIIYGIREYGLSRDLHISVGEAKQIISDYLRKYPGIDAYMKEIVAFASKHGYVETLMGRRRYLPELSSTKYQIRSFGERIAMNTPIQGTAADIIKVAMVKVYDELRRRKLKSSLVLQVHDELLIDALRSEQEEVQELLKDCMETAFEMTVPLIVTVSSGMNFDFKG